MLIQQATRSIGRRTWVLSVMMLVACGHGQTEVPPPASAPARAQSSAQSVPALVVSGPGAYWQPAPVAVVAGAPDQHIDETSPLQEWHGFGGTFNEAGWEALSQVSAADRQRALELLFDAERGARFSYGRIPIGANDYAIDRYTLNERADDYAMAGFSIERDRQRLIPYVRAALAVKPDLHLWASPWTPPAWMKDNHSTDGGRIRSEPAVLEGYALYLARFVEAYAGEKIQVEAVQPQNEPGYAQTYPTCLWTPELLRDFVRDHLGPTFIRRGLSTQIWFGTLSAPEDVQHVSTIMADADADRYVRGIGVQWNTLSAVPGFAKSYGLPIMQTEHRCGNYPWRKNEFNVNRAPNDHAYAMESWGLIADWVRAGVNSYLAWNMVLDTVGLNMDVERPWPQNALLTVDRQAHTLNVTPAYYVFRHLSQFVDPGARRLGTSGDADALAFRNPDGSVVAVLYNPNDSARQVTLGVKGTSLRFDVPAQGWATLDW